MAVRFYAIFLTFNFITVTRIWFRAQTMEAANSIMHQITNAFNFAQIGEIVLAYKNIFAVMLIAMIIHWLPVKTKDAYKSIFINSPEWVKVVTMVIAVFIIWQVRTADLQAFIYFQF